MILCLCVDCKRGLCTKVSRIAFRNPVIDVRGYNEGFYLVASTGTALEVLAGLSGMVEMQISLLRLGREG